MLLRNDYKYDSPSSKNEKYFIKCCNLMSVKIVSATDQVKAICCYDMHIWFWMFCWVNGMMDRTCIIELT